MSQELAPGWRLLREIGRGGAGVVYLAKARDGSDVAIKVLTKGASRDALERFEREKRLLETLTAADGFVPLLASGRGPAGPFVVMPFLPGGTLRDKLRRGPLSIEETVALARSLATALAHAHERGIVHRDLKPENVLFDATNTALVADLGLAKHFSALTPGASQSVALSKTGEFRGTPGYMAPEQAAESRDAGPEADVFSIGAILYEALAGTPPFRAESLMALLENAAAGRFRPLASLRPDAPSGLVRVIEKALTPDPAARFEDADALLAALDAPPSARGRWALVFLAIVALVLVGAIGVVVAKRATAPAPGPETTAPVATSPSQPAASAVRLAGKTVPAADGKEVPLGLYRLPDGTDMELVEVPAGKFLSGTDAKDAPDVERPQRTRTLDHSLWIGRNDVTWNQFLSYCKATGAREPEKTYWSRGTHPVVNVNFGEARAYCAWARLGLPRDAEWEKAARGTDGRSYPWGDEWRSDRCNFADSRAPASYLVQGGMNFELKRDKNADDGWPFTSPVGTYPAGASPYGALDMAGNVWRWCEIDASDGTLRGGCWASEAKDCRSYLRMRDLFPVEPSSCAYVGFRVVLRP
ncbi:MAG TPA: bifunctional serine/threonine-protein kinase/formylglycine-generating enzyme family protein [Planctomycetota bacterium]|nr:bifunctional serine/threonine-protein kinase/formylglycine-generating enzyme family protein [Planctomycetota bacterium]